MQRMIFTDPAAIRLSFLSRLSGRFLAEEEKKLYVSEKSLSR